MWLRGGCNVVVLFHWDVNVFIHDSYLIPVITEVLHILRHHLLVMHILATDSLILIIINWIINQTDGPGSLHLLWLEHSTINHDRIISHSGRITLILNVNGVILQLILNIINLLLHNLLLLFNLLCLYKLLMIVDLTANVLCRITVYFILFLIFSAFQHAVGSYISISLMFWFIWIIDNIACNIWRNYINWCL